MRRVLAKTVENLIGKLATLRNRLAPENPVVVTIQTAAILWRESDEILEVANERYDLAQAIQRVTGGRVCAGQATMVTYYALRNRGAASKALDKYDAWRLIEEPLLEEVVVDADE